jgi:hypothetical protein
MATNSRSRATKQPASSKDVPPERPASSSGAPTSSSSTAKQPDATTKPTSSKPDITKRAKDAVEQPPAPPSATKKKTAPTDEELDRYEAEKAQAITDAISRMGAGQLSKKQKEEVRERAEKALSPPDPDVACVAHLNNIVRLANRYATKFTTDPAVVRAVREYVKLLLGLNRKTGNEKERLAKGHTGILRTIYRKFQVQLKDEDLTWLDAGTREEPTANPVVLITYGKGDRAQLPLSDLYHHLNATDKEDVLADAADLDYQLWSIFSKLAVDKEELKLYERLADERKASIAPEGELVGISAAIRDKVLANPNAVNLDADTANPGEIMKTVFSELGQSDAMKQALEGFATSAADGTFDLNRILRAATEGVNQPTNAEVDEDKDD